MLKSLKRLGTDYLVVAALLENDKLLTFCCWEKLILLFYAV